MRRRACKGISVHGGIRQPTCCCQQISASAALKKPDALSSCALQAPGQQAALLP